MGHFSMFLNILELINKFFARFRIFCGIQYIIWKTQESFYFQKMCVFPKRNNDKSLFFGKAMDAEHRKKEKESRFKKNNNQINIPQAREAMDKFKMQAASEVGVNLTNGYNGHLTSREAGSVGGQMVKKMIEAYE